MSEALEKLNKEVHDLQEQAFRGIDKDTAKSAVEKLLADQEKALEKREISQRRNGEYNLGKETPKSLSNLATLIKMKNPSPEVRTLQRTWDDAVITAAILKNDVRSSIRSPFQTKIWKRFEPTVEQSELEKAMSGATVGEGAEWLPTGMSAEITDLVELECKLWDVHPHITIPIGQGSFDIPRVTSKPTAYIQPQGSSRAEASASIVRTGKATLKLTSLITFVPIEYELTEDAIAAYLPMIKKKMVDALKFAIEDAVINGDTSATHQDEDVTASDDVRKAWMGYRKKVLPAAKKDLSTFNFDTIMSLRGSMQSYGVDPAQLVFICSPQLYANKILTLRDAQNNPMFTTVDKLGPKAVVLTGELGALGGIPLIVSAKVREDLNASGWYDGTTTDRTILLLVRKEGFVFGDKRGVTIESERKPTWQNINLVAAQREAFVDCIDASSERIVAEGYNITY